MFDSYRVFYSFPPEIWRLVTPFLISGPQVGLILDPYFAYQYLSQLETTNPKFARKEDVLWYLITVGGIIVVGFCLPLSFHPHVTLFSNNTPRISARIVHALPTITVPGNEEDYPCALGLPSFALRVWFGVQIWVGSLYG